MPTLSGKDRSPRNFTWLCIVVDLLFLQNPNVLFFNTSSNLFFMKTAKDFRDSHIWFSVISRPPCSTFTRVQRVSCCFSLLLCTMLTSIMFWGIPTDPSEQTMDLGRSEKAMRKCLKQALFPMASRGRCHWFKKRCQIVCHFMRKRPDFSLDLLT